MTEEINEEKTREDIKDTKQINKHYVSDYVAVPLKTVHYSGGISFD